MGHRVIADLVAALCDSDPVGQSRVDIFNRQEKSCFQTKFVKQRRDVLKLAVASIIVSR